MLKLEHETCFIDKAFSLVLFHIKEMFNYVRYLSLLSQQSYYECVKDFAYSNLKELMCYFVSVNGEEQLNERELQSCTSFEIFMKYVYSINDKKYFTSIMNTYNRMLQQNTSSNGLNEVIEDASKQDYLCMMPSSCSVESVFAVLKRVKRQNMNEQTYTNRITCSSDIKKAWFLSFKYQN